MLCFLQPFSDIPLRTWVHLCQDDISHDDGQEVVKIVGNAAGKDAEGFKLLRLDQFILHLLAVGEVPADGGNGNGLARFLVKDRKDVRLDRNGPVRRKVPEAQLSFPFTPLPDQGHDLPQFLAVILYNVLISAFLPDFLYRTDADERATGRIDIEGLSVQRRHADKVRGIFDDGRQLLLFFQVERVLNGNGGLVGDVPVLGQLLLGKRILRNRVLDQDGQSFPFKHHGHADGGGYPPFGHDGRYFKARFRFKVVHHTGHGVLHNVRREPLPLDETECVDHCLGKAEGVLDNQAFFVFRQDHHGGKIEGQKVLRRVDDRTVQFLKVRRDRDRLRHLEELAEAPRVSCKPGL